jgi:hypothetical protein
MIPIENLNFKKMCVRKWVSTESDSMGFTVQKRSKEITSKEVTAGRLPMKPMEARKSTQKELP